MSDVQRPFVLFPVVGISMPRPVDPRSLFHRMGYEVCDWRGEERIPGGQRSTL